MNCALCKAGLSSGRVNHIVDLGKRIIIIKKVLAEVCGQWGNTVIVYIKAVAGHTVSGNSFLCARHGRSLMGESP